MKKINNKGLTIVELLIVFVILMVLVTSMMSVILSLKNKQTDSKLHQDLLEFKTTFTKVIQDDLLDNGTFSEVNCIFDPNIIEEVLNCSLSFSDITKKLIIYNSLNNKYIKYGELGKEIIYTIPNSSDIELSNPSVTSDNKFLKINIPYTIINEEDNYGINIVYPIGLK